MVSKIKAIHNSRVEYKDELTETQEDRLDICKKCPHNSENQSDLSFTVKFYIFLNQLLNRCYGLKVLVNSVCVLCGCSLVHMSSQEDEENKCKLKKW